MHWREMWVWIMLLMFEVWIMKKMLPWHSSSLILDKSVHMLNLPDKIRQNFQTTLKISHFIKAVGVQTPQGARYAEKCWSIKFVWEQTNHVYIDSFIKFDRFLWTVEPQLQQTWTEEEPWPSQYSKNFNYLKIMKNYRYLETRSQTVLLLFETESSCVGALFSSW